MIRWLFTALILSIACSFISPSVVEARDNKNKARKLINKGDKYLEKGDRFMNANKVEKGLVQYERALAAYTKAYEAFPNPQIFYGIALAEQKLGRFLEAIKHYQEMLQNTENANEELVDAVNTAIAKVKKKLSGLDIRVEQTGASVTIDGKLLGKTPLPGIHYVLAGQHQYSVELKGHTPVEESLDLKQGQTVSREILLESTETAPEVVDAGESEVGVESSDKKKPAGVSKLPATIAFGVGGGFLLGATLTGVWAKSKHKRYQDKERSVSSREAARNTGKKYRLATDVLLGGAAIAVGYGVYYYYFKYKPSKEKRGKLSIWVNPYATETQAGAIVGARF